jgi:hypothetical protein
MPRARRAPSFTCSSCASWSRCRRRTKRGCVNSPTKTACSSICRAQARTPPCRCIRARRDSPTHCPNSDSYFRFRRPNSRRSIARSTACSCGARSRCSIRSRTSASRISSAASATSRCPSQHAPRAYWASKAAPRSLLARARTPSATDCHRERVLRLPTCSRRARRASNRWAVRQGAHRPATRRRDCARQGAARQRRAEPHRLRFVQSGDARARRRGARAGARLYARRGGCRQHVSAHGARRVDRAVRTLSAKKRATARPPACCRSSELQSRCPVSAISR